MPSPFPGMDAYLEAQGLWQSFLAAMVTHSAELLNHFIAACCLASFAL
jgi:hypothetical protein